MLILSRKPQQQIHIGGKVVVTVLESKGNKVKLGIDAPPDVEVLRAELLDNPQPVQRHALSRQKRILIVDDNPDDRLLVRRFLGNSMRQNFAFSESELGEEGLERCRRERPDCVFLDYRLPDLTGLEFLSVLRQEQTSRHIPVIVLTGEGSEHVAMRATLGGAQVYLSKNEISAEILQQALSKAISAVNLN